MTRLLLFLLLLSLSAIVDARDVRMHGPNGDGGAACDAPMPVVGSTTSPKRAPVTLVHAKVKAPTLFRGGDEDTGPHAPRWHSFLPGMFR